MSDSHGIPEQLPEDISACHLMIVELVDELKRRNLLNEKLQHQLDHMMRARYGQKADRIDPNQLCLFDLAAVATQAPESTTEEEEAQQQPAPESKTPKRKGHGRNVIPENLPKERVVHDVPADKRTCPKCGDECRCIGEETSRQLEYIPASLKVIEHVRLKYACGRPDCRGAVILAEKPDQPIEKGLAGPGLLAHVITSKYADHLPLHRQEDILARHGVEISRGTMCGWAMQSADLVEPLYDLMGQRVLESKVIHTDDTTVSVLDRRLTKTRTGRLWVYVGDGDYPYTVYDYTPNRKRDGPASFLEGFSGYLQADAYAGYDKIYAPGDVVEIACWAHARRKYVDAQGSDPVRAVVATAWIRGLYEVEHKAAGLSADERRALRQEHSKPMLDKFEKWLREEYQKVLPKSPIGGAISYSLSNWQALVQYVEDGDLAIDNNAAERALRPVAVGRKNWMFAGSDRGGRAAAILGTLVQSAKRHGLDPFEYLRDVFARIASHPMSRLEEFLPDRWAAERAAA